MEEILSSIKRIIAEEGEGGTATRARRAPRAAPPPAIPLDETEDEVLELSDPVEAVQTPAPMAIGAPDVPPQPAEPILSARAAEAMRAPLEALSRIVVKPEVPGTDTLEGLVREMLKPMLSEWLDANLPQIVETMVAREIERITGRK